MSWSSDIALAAMRGIGDTLNLTPIEFKSVSTQIQNPEFAARRRRSQGVVELKATISF